MKSFKPMDFVFPSRRLIERFVAFCQQRTLLLAIVYLSVSTLGAWGTFHLLGNVDTSLESLLPDYYHSVRTLKKINREGGKIFDDLYAEGDDPHQLIELAKIVKKRLEPDPLFYGVQFKQDQIIPVENKFLYLSQEQLISINQRIKRKIGTTKLKRSGFFVSLLDEDEENELDNPENDLALSDLKKDDPFLLAKEGSLDQYFFSPDKKIIGIQIRPTRPPSDLAYTQKVYKKIFEETALLKEQFPDVNFYHLGPYRKRLDEYQIILYDLKILSSLTIFGVLLSLLIFYRRLSSVMMIGMPLTLGIFWALGFVNVTLGHLNTLTSALIGILFGLGIDFSIHMYSRYIDDTRQGLSSSESLINMLYFAGRSSFTSALTTAVVFMSLLLADFKGFSEFGYIAGCGVLICYLAIFLILPVLIIISERLAEKVSQWGIPKFSLEKLSFWKVFPTFIPENQKTFPMIKPILLGSTGLIILFFIILPDIKFDYDLGKLKADVIDYKTESAIRKRFNKPRSVSVAVVVMDSHEDIPAVDKAVKEKVASDLESPTVSRLLSLYDVWPPPKEQEARMVLIRDIQRSLEDDAIKLLSSEDQKKIEDLRELTRVKPIPLDSVPTSAKNFFSPRDGNIGIYGYILAKENMKMKDGRDAMKFAEDTREIHTEEGKTLYASSETLVYADVLGLMLHDSKSAISLCIFLIFLLVWLDFGNLKHTLLVLTPLTIGTLLMLILLNAYGHKLNFFNMIVLPLIVGLGVDDGIHFFHRYLQEGRGSVNKTMRTTGKAIWMTSLTTFIGFFGLSLGHYKGLQSIGYLAMAGILGCLLTSLTTLPALIQWLENKKRL